MTDGATTSLEKYVDLLCCPHCQAVLSLEDQTIRCTGCDHLFETSDGIPLLFWPTEGVRRDVTAEVRAFYEVTPFPNYNDIDDVGTLVEKAQEGVFTRLLDEQIPFWTRVLEVGCGTGQLSNFLSVAARTVVGTDVCLNSLRLGQQFKERNCLARVAFIQMNLFRPVFRPETFDLVISNGVLHHTADPRRAFETIATLVRPNGYILIGLYHRYGRLVTDLRRLIFRAFGDRWQFLDPNLRRRGSSAAKKRAWFMDQYRHPHESKHTMGEVLHWFDEVGFEFVHSIPSPVPFRPFSPTEQLFKPRRRGRALEHLCVELGMAFRGSQQGGFFVMIGKKRRAANAVASGVSGPSVNRTRA